MLYLYWHAFINRLRSQALRARSPRYIVAVLLGALYLWWALFRNTRGGSAPLNSLLLSDVTRIVGSAVLLLLSARWWIFGADRSALAFTPAEVQGQLRQAGLHGLRVDPLGDRYLEVWGRLTASAGGGTTAPAES